MSEQRGGDAAPSRQDDRPGMSMLDYFMAHAPFDMNDVPTTRPNDADPQGPSIDLTEDERLDRLADLRFAYARKMVRKAKRG